MTEVRQLDRVAGSLFDVSGLQGLSEDTCNLLLVSDRTLFLLERFARNEVNWQARYIEQYVGADEYIPVDEASDDFDFVKEVARIFRLEVTDMSCDLVTALNSIAAAISEAQAASCGCEIGSDVDTDDGETGGPLPGPVNGVEYEEASAIEDRKCLAANYIHQSILAIVTELKLNRADQYGFAGLAFVLSLLATTIGALVAGPVGLLVGAVVGSFLAMATLLFKASFSLALLETAIEGDEQAGICALYSAWSASDAREAYLDYLADEGATSLELEFVEYFLSNNLLNLLFFAWGDSEEVIAEVTPTHVCTTCPTAYGCPWEFLLDGETPLGSGDLTKDGTSRVLTSVPYSGYHIIVIQLDSSLTYPGEDCDNETFINASMYLTSVSDPGVYSPSRGKWTGEQWGSFGTDIPFTGPLDAAYFELAHATIPFTVEYTLYPGNEPG